MAINQSRKQIYKILILIFPLIMLASFILLKVKLPEAYRYIIREDSYIEYAQFLFFFLSGLLSLVISINFLRTEQRLLGLLYLVLALGFLFVAFEEISWGQRLFNLQAKGYFEERNLQKEYTLHNLNGLTPLHGALCQIIGFYGTFMWLLLPKGIKAISTVRFLIPDWYLAFYFLPSLFRPSYYKYYRSLQDVGFAVWRQQEPIEFLLALGLFLFIAIGKYRQSNMVPDKNPSFARTPSV